MEIIFKACKDIDMDNDAAWSGCRFWKQVSVFFPEGDSNALKACVWLPSNHTENTYPGDPGLRDVYCAVNYFSSLPGVVTMDQSRSDRDVIVDFEGLTLEKIAYKFPLFERLDFLIFNLLDGNLDKYNNTLQVAPYFISTHDKISEYDLAESIIKYSISLKTTPH